jgi:hypothetical protein
MGGPTGHPWPEQKEGGSGKGDGCWGYGIVHAAPYSSQIF